MSLLSLTSRQKDRRDHDRAQKAGLIAMVGRTCENWQTSHQMGEFTGMEKQLELV